MRAVAWASVWKNEKQDSEKIPVAGAVRKPAGNMRTLSDMGEAMQVQGVLAAVGNSKIWLSLMSTLSGSRQAGYQAVE